MDRGRQEAISSGLGEGLGQGELRAVALQLVVGRDLVVRKAEENWGKGVVEQASLDLKVEFPHAKGFSARNLWNMKRWYLFFCKDKDFADKAEALGTLPDLESTKLQQVAAKTTEHVSSRRDDPVTPFPAVFGFVPCGHHVQIITRCGSVDEALFYVRKTIEDGLSRNALVDLIRADLCHSLGNVQTNYVQRLSGAQGRLAREMVKDTYDFGFVTLTAGYSERALEDALEQSVTKFLLERGTGFAFVGRQKEIVVSGKTRLIDMLFYHILLKCYVVIELKVRTFEPAFVCQLNFYVSAVDNLIRTESENPTIGLLVCKDRDCTEVRWSLNGVAKPLGVAEYDNVVVKDVRALLPSDEQIQQMIRQTEEEFKIASEDAQGDQAHPE